MWADMVQNSFLIVFHFLKHTNKVVDKSIIYFHENYDQDVKILL